MKTLSFVIVVVGACALVLAGFYLPWFAFPDAALSINHLSPSSQLPAQVSGLDMLLGGQAYTRAYAPFLLPEIFALLWLLPVCALWLSTLLLTEIIGKVRSQLWTSTSEWPRWIFMALLLLPAGLLLGPVIIGPDGPPQFSGGTNRLSGIIFLSGGFFLLLLSLIWLIWQRRREAFSTSGPSSPVSSLVEEGIQPNSRRILLFSLLGLVTVATLGTGGYLVGGLWLRRRTLASFPLVTNFQQPSRENLQALSPVLRDGRIFWSVDGKRLFTFLVDFYAQNRQITDGGILQVYQYPTQDVALSPDSSMLALLDPGQGTPAIVRADRGTLVVAARSQNISSTTARGLAWSSDGNRLAIAGALLNPLTQTVTSAGVWCYDALSGDNLRTYQAGSLGNLHAVAWSPDGHYLASAGDVTSINGDEIPGAVFVWEVESGQLIFHTPTNYWSAIAWSPDSQQLAVAHGTNVEIWEPVRARRLLVYAQHLTEVWALAWSPHGKLLASAASTDGLVHIWESTTGQMQQVYQGHSSTVTDLAWSADGATLASCDRRQVNIWSAG
ncbi:MAG TPA: hypothetical protein VFN35_12740 [Ktedonobacteraceae bacterium]|nr:hypothetical protein [Ktedonobacteraceae bacterium]